MSGNEVRKLSFADLQGMANKRGVIKLKNTGKEKIIFEIEGTNIDGATLDNLRMKVKGNVELKITGEAGVTKMVATKGAQVDAKESAFDKIILRAKGTKAEVKEFDIARKHATKNELIEDGRRVTPFDDGSNYERNVKLMKAGKAVALTTGAVFSGMGVAGAAMGTAISSDLAVAWGASAVGSGLTLAIPGKSKDSDGNKLSNLRFTIKKPLELKPKKETDCPECPEAEIKEVIKYVEIPCPEVTPNADATPIKPKKPELDTPPAELKPHVIQHAETINELKSKMPDFELPQGILKPNCATGKDIIPVGEEVLVREDVDTSKDKSSTEAKNDFAKWRINNAIETAKTIKEEDKKEYTVKKGDSYWKIAERIVGTDCKEEIAKQMFLIQHGLNKGKALKAGETITITK